MPTRVHIQTKAVVLAGRRHMAGSLRGREGKGVRGAASEKPAEEQQEQEGVRGRLP